MFPIANEQGKVIAFTGRTLATDEKSGPKYLNSPETPIYSKSRVLFNLDKAKEAIRKLDYAILVEGQMDCISVYTAGFHNVIASSGTAFTEPQARLLGALQQEHRGELRSRHRRRRRRRALAGAAGQRGLPDQGAHAGEPASIPTSTSAARAATAYTEALRALAEILRLPDRARPRAVPVRTPEGKVKALNYLLPHIQRVPSRIVRDELANEISHRLGIESSVLRQELRHAADCALGLARDRAGGSGS